MPGKRPRPLHRTTSSSLLNFDAIANQCSPLPEQHPVEKHKQGKGPVMCARRQVIGFAAPPPPAAFPDDASLEAEKKPASTSSPTRPCPPHRSGLCDLFAPGGRQCWKKEEGAPGVGLGIVAAMEKGGSKDECRGHHGARTTEQQQLLKGGIDMDCLGRLHPHHHHHPHHQQQQQPLFKPVYPVPIAGLTQHVVDIAPAKPQGPRRSPRESYIGIMPPTTARAGGSSGISNNSGTTTSLVVPPPPTSAAWPPSSVPLLLPETSKLFPSLSSTPLAKSTTAAAAAPSGFTALHFLDACYFCKRSFVEDCDIYMYRGDKAFCSVECRHFQIVQDERLEKCSAAALASGGAITPARHISQRNRVMAVAAGTAAAA